MPALFLLIVILIAAIPTILALVIAPKPQPPARMQLTVKVKRRPRKK